MKAANIDLLVESLTLRGLPYAHRHHIAAAVEQELMRLLTEHGLPPSLANGGNVPYVGIDSLHVSSDMKPDAIGVQIARQVYRTLS